ncbi:hypothetical protein [Salinispora arenicola]|uniref:hypothetical protein n=1 Tax=Salinispora arenicola TaxID=168697 RepID=UPI00035E3633|nr:hypothetical protein [Salinispora arenicola]
MSHSAAGERPATGRPAVPPTTVTYSAAEWDLLSSLPGWTIVAAARQVPGLPAREVAAGLAGLDAVAAGRAFDSDLIRAVVATIYARHDSSANHRRRDGAASVRNEERADAAELLAAVRTAVRVLDRRADPADSAAYRQWVQSVAARVCRAGLGEDAGAVPRDHRFLARLGGALGLG